MTYPTATGGVPESHENFTPEIVFAISAVLLFSVRVPVGFRRRLALGLWIVLDFRCVCERREKKKKKLGPLWVVSIIYRGSAQVRGY